MAYHHDKGVKSKKSTRLVNDTDVKLLLYYMSSNGNPYFRKTLHPRPSNENDASVYVSPDTRVTTVNDGVELTDGHTFIEEFDSNNTFGMLRLWDETNRLVVALDTDLLIDNREITIICSDDGKFALKLTGRLCDEKLPVVALDMDELFDNGEIIITVSDDCIFKLKFACMVKITYIAFVCCTSSAEVVDEKRPIVALDMDELIDNREIIINISDGNLEPKIWRSQEKHSKDAENCPGKSSATPEPGNWNIFGKIKQFASNKISSFRPPRPNGG